ncbi:MAG: HEPN domain-containing protein [Caulobacteraceae bacterium]
MQSHGLLDQVDKLIEHARQIATQLSAAEGAYVQAQLVQHACVLTCAALEQSIVESASSYAGRVGDERLRGFVAEILKIGRSPSPEYICEVFRRFDARWASHLEEFMENEVGADSIKSIVSNRNRIAHGESVSMGVVSLSSWVPAARKLCLEIYRLTDTALGDRNQRRKARRRRR